MLKFSSKLELGGRLPLELLETKVNQILYEWQHQFEEFQENQKFRVRETKTRKKQILRLDELLTERFQSLLKTLNNNQGYRILLDGLRWDIWQEIRKHLSQSISLRVIEEGSLLASLPTNTETQMEQLKSAGLRDKIINPDEFTEGTGNIVKFGFIDDKVHTLKDDYYQFVLDILFQTENRLIPFINKLPSGSPILIFSDHGYQINSSFRQQDKYDSPRYLHGGASMFERIVPWTMLYKV